MLERTNEKVRKMRIAPRVKEGEATPVALPSKVGTMVPVKAKAIKGVNGNQSAVDVENRITATADNKNKVRMFKPRGK